MYVLTYLYTYLQIFLNVSIWFYINLNKRSHSCFHYLRFLLVFFQCENFYLCKSTVIGASQVVALVIKNLPTNAGDVRDVGSIPKLGGCPWRRVWQPTPVFLPGESPWTEKPGKRWSIGSQRVRHDLNDLARTHTDYEICLLHLVTSSTYFQSYLGQNLSFPSSLVRSHHTL